MGIILAFQKLVHSSVCGRAGKDVYSDTGKRKN
jgi:hypothetical protein